MSLVNGSSTMVNGSSTMRNGFSVLSAVLVGVLLIAAPGAMSAEIPLNAGKQVAQKCGDQLNLGLSAVQRVGNWSTAIRGNLSLATDGESKGIGDGFLLSAELFTTVPGSNDIFYLNPFVSIGQYSQLGRELISGGPLGSLGIMYASLNLGAYGAELSPFTDDNIGFATGYQAFWDHTRRYMIIELAGRINYDNNKDTKDAIGVGVQCIRRSEVTSKFRQRHFMHSVQRLQTM